MTGSRVLLAAALALAASASLPALPARACWVAPPEVKVETAQDGRYALRRFNRTGLVEVFAVDDPDGVLWSAQVQGFSQLFSELHLVDDGRLLVHVRGNHQVGSRRDVAVEAYTEQGRRWRVRAGQLVPDLRDHPPGRDPRVRISTDPAQWWLDRVVSVTTAEIRLQTIDGTNHHIDPHTGHL